MENTTAYIHPVDNPHNAYTKFQLETLKKIGLDIQPLTAMRKHPWLLFVRRKQHKICILNWFESRIIKPDKSLSLKGLLSFLLYYSLISLSGTQLYYVRHNNIPHDAKGLTLTISRWAMHILEKKAQAVITHNINTSDPNEYYIPHPLYKETPPIHNSFNRNPSFICLGNIMAYKGLDNLLEAWPKDLSLKIWGTVVDPDYAQLLQDIALKRKLNVDFYFQYVSEAELANVLNDSDVMVLAHQHKSAIVSGSFYLAKSYGLFILLREDGLEFDKNDSFVLTFKSASKLDKALRKIVSTLPRIEKLQIFNQAYDQCEPSEIAARWKKLLSNDLKHE